MSDPASTSSANYVLLTRLADEFAARYRAGERPSIQEYVDRHPELAEDIRELLPAMVEIEQFKEDHQEATEQAAARPARGPAARRFPHPPRGRQGGHGHRLRGRAGIAGAPRGAQAVAH